MPSKKSPSPVERETAFRVECIIPNVHLGDGRKLVKGESATVPAELGALLVERGQARRV